MNPPYPFDASISFFTPEEGIILCNELGIEVSREAVAVVDSQCWTKVDPTLDRTSFATTCLRREAQDHALDVFRNNFSEPGMYSGAKAADGQCVRRIGFRNEPKETTPHGTAGVEQFQQDCTATMRPELRENKELGRFGDLGKSRNDLTGIEACTQVGLAMELARNRRKGPQECKQSEGGRRRHRACTDKVSLPKRRTAPIRTGEKRKITNGARRRGREAFHREQAASRFTC